MAIVRVRQRLRLRPTLSLLGDVDHADFREALQLVRSTAEVASTASRGGSDLILFAQSRPGIVPLRQLDSARRQAPLAGIVSLLGSWCEGESRTGRPPEGVRRVYWYDFAGWWHRQLALWATGRCPDWARVDDFPTSHGFPRGTGSILLQTTCLDTARALADVLSAGGYTATTTRRSDITAAIWEGCQMDAGEASRFEEFCRTATLCGATIIALLDFPRRDRCEYAIRAGAAAVLGKPWENGQLLAALARRVDRRRPLQAA